MDNPLFRGLQAGFWFVINFAIRMAATASCVYVLYAAPQWGPLSDAALLAGCLFFAGTIGRALRELTGVGPDKSVEPILDASAVVAIFAAGSYLVFSHNWFIASGWHAAATLASAVALAMLFLEKAFAIGKHRPDPIFWLSN